VLGAVPPSGTPVVFRADHPLTGGYPVIGVVAEDEPWQCAQLRPGDEMRFTREREAAPRG
jgi:allophanate hydrolase subunit 2